MTQRKSALVILVVGVLLALVSLLADALGIGASPGSGTSKGPDSSLVWC